MDIFEQKYKQKIEKISDISGHIMKKDIAKGFDTTFGNKNVKIFYQYFNLIIFI